MKGKVENPFRYIDDHFIKGNEFKDLEDLNRRFKEFLIKEWNKKLHSRALRTPEERFKEEKPFLLPLPSHRFIPSQRDLRKVSWDSLISVDGRRFSVPWSYAGKSVWVKNNLGDKLLIFNLKSVLIATHRIPERKDETIIDPSHYEGLKVSFPRSRPEVREKFIESFPRCGKEFFLKLFEKYKYNAILWASKILILSFMYGTEEMEEVMSEALKYGSYSLRTLHFHLEKKPMLRPKGVSQKVYPSLKIKRPISYYTLSSFEGGPK